MENEDSQININDDMINEEVQLNENEEPIELVNKSLKKSNKSQKKKKQITRDEKANLWNIFETQVEENKKMEEKCKEKRKYRSYVCWSRCWCV